MQSFLPHVGGRAVAACLRRDYNPDAPAVVLVGAGEGIEQAADMLVAQRSPVPTFLKLGTGDWEYVGEYTVERSSQDAADLAAQARRSGRDDITRVIYMVPSPHTDAEQLVVYFNNCHNRDHVALFGSGAFFDLGRSGRQGSQARNLQPGQPCVVAEWAPDKLIVFDWYSFTYEALLPDEHGAPDRVFFGRLFASEALPKDDAARSERYAALFRSNGHLKIGSVFHKAIRSDRIPLGNVAGVSRAANATADAQTGAGFGDPAENKLVEVGAVRAVVKSYEGDGWSVRSVERDKCGFDLECTKNGSIENVEVKGVRGAAPCFIITAGEVKQAQTNATFVLVVVTSALSESPKITKYSGVEFCQRFDLSAIQFRAVLRP
jgi:hypothetical protein